jgi:hypothetical protein
MRRILTVIGAVALLGAVPATASAKAPFLSKATATSKVAKITRQYRDWRMSNPRSWDDTMAVYWDDYAIDSPECKRIKRNVVDCRLGVTLWESDPDDWDPALAEEICKWKLRVRKQRYGFVSVYNPATPGGGDISTVECVGWYEGIEGEPEAEPEDR